MHTFDRRRALTLMIMISVDRKGVGLAAGSNTDELDWKDWKSPLISRLNANLLRKRTRGLLERNFSTKLRSTYEIRYCSVE
jgi:hypothetical protein